MTISNTAVSTTVTCNGTQTVFNYAFLIPAGAVYELQQTDLSGNVTTIPTSAYSVSGIGNSTGGTFTYAPSGAAVPNGYLLTFTRLVPYQQLTSLANQGTYYPGVVEAAMDWLEMQIQQLADALYTGAPFVPLSSKGQPLGVAPLDNLGNVSSLKVLPTNGTTALSLAVIAASQTANGIPAGVNGALLGLTGTAGIGAAITTIKNLILGANASAYPTVALFRSTFPWSTATDGQLFDISYYSAEGDCPTRKFKWVIFASSPPADNGGTILNPTGNTTNGRAILQFSGAADLRWFGAVLDGVTDCYPAYTAAKAASGGAVYFPYVLGSANIYYFGTMNGSDLNGIILEADPGVTISIPYNAQPYASNGSTAMTVKNDVSVIYRDIGLTVYWRALQTQSPVNPTLLQTASRQNVSAPNLSSVSPIRALTVQWPSSDTFTAVTPGSLAATVRTYSISTSGYFTGDFYEVGPGESVHSLVVSESGSNVYPAILVRTANGFYAFFESPSALGAGIDWGIKPLGASVISETNIPVPGQGVPLIGGATFDLMDMPRASLGFARLSRNTFVIYVNGKALAQPPASGNTAPTPWFASSDIIDVGFCGYVASGTGSWFSGYPTLRRDSVILGIDQLPSILVVGDSTAATYVGGWAQILPQYMDGAFGVKVQKIVNYAILGETLEQQYAILTANGVGTARYVVIAVGTNDIQGGESIATFLTNLTTMLTYLSGQGCIPVFVLPFLWYPNTANGNNGQNTSNYDLGATYRQAIANAVAALAPNAVLVDSTLEFPFPNPTYLPSGSNPQPDPLLRDNIHQSPQLQALYAQAIGKAIFGHMCAVPDAESIALPTAYGLYYTNSNITPNGTVPVTFMVTKNGSVSMTGAINVSGTIADGTTVFQIPRYLWPTQTVVYVPSVCQSGSSNNLGGCLIGVGANGQVKVYGVQSGTTIIQLSGAWVPAAAQTAAH